jgi:hypothetical protein
MLPRLRSSWVIVSGVAVGVLVVLAAFSVGGAGFFSHVTCDLGGAVGSETIWTPYSLTNAPYPGTSYYKANFSLFETFGPTKVAASGSLGGGNISTGYFETQDWTIHDQSNRTVVGPGLNHPCASRYAATPSAPVPDISVQGLPLQGPGNTSNAGEPTTFNDSGPLPSAVFSNGFVSANLPPITTCGTSSKELNFSSTSFDVSLTVPSSSGSVTAIVAIASAESYTYFFPANSGTWLVDDLQLNSGLVGPGLAFSWQPC